MPICQIVHLAALFAIVVPVVRITALQPNGTTNGRYDCTKDWDKLRKAAVRFKLNRLEIGRDEKAGPALVRIEEILGAASPYALIKEAEDLITTVDAVNTTLIGENRSQATKKIDEHVAAIKKDLKIAGGDTALETACVQPVERVRGQVEKSESIAHITQGAAEAIKEFDAAVRRIEEFAKKKALEGIKTDKPQVVVKPQRVVKPAELMTGTYLESKEDVEEFLAKLRKQLDEAIEKNERIQIR